MLSLYFSFMVQALCFTLALAMSTGSEESCKYQTSVCRSMSQEWLLVYLPDNKHPVPATYPE